MVNYRLISLALTPVVCIHNPWHYPNSPKNGKPALSPRHDWLNTGSLLQNIPLRIWFYPQ
ncbi:hypothetical protein J4U56_22215 [Escherichia coli]